MCIVISYKLETILCVLDFILGLHKLNIKVRQDTPVFLTAKYSLICITTFNIYWS